MNEETKCMIRSIVLDYDYFYKRYKLLMSYNPYVLVNNMEEEVIVYCNYYCKLEQIDYFKVDRRKIASWLVKYLLVRIEQNNKIELGLYD